MAKMSFKNNIYVVAKISNQVNNRQLDYYLVIPGRGYKYAFSKKFKRSCYNFCKSPVLLNKVLYNRCHDKSLMNLKKYFHHIMSYLVYCYGLEDFMLNNGRNKAA